jgi:predicted dehydrogenase
LSEILSAIIGCGKIADQHAQQIRRVAGARLVGVCDSEKLMADQLAERFQVPHSFDDVDHLLKDTSPHVVHITTPPHSHFELTRKCLMAGCHVYVEKPFSVHYAEAQSMVALAEQKNLRLTAGHNYQFSPEMMRMRQLVSSGVIGNGPVHVESIYSYNLGDPSYARALLGDDSHWVRRLPGQLLQNVISHGIAKIAEFFDPDVTVQAHGFTSPILQQAGETAIIDELRVLISDGQNRTAYFTFTSQMKPPVQELRVFGTKGAIIVDNLHRTTVHLTRSNSDFKSYLNFFVPPVTLACSYGRNLLQNMTAFLKSDFHADAGMKNLIERFYRSIQFGDPLPISYREILLTAAIMDEIFGQLRSHRENGSARKTSHLNERVAK